MRKKRSRKTRAIMYETSDFEELRPVTASLKESLTASLTRISLEATNATNATITRNNGKQPISAIRSRTHFALSLDSSLEPELTVTAYEAASNPEVKQLDDNNNKNKNSGQLQRLLSPVCLRTSRGALNSSEVALSTKVSENDTPTKKKLGSCRICGRVTQPERFHSHPKSLTNSSFKSPLQIDMSSSMPVAPPRAANASKSFHKTFGRTEQQVGPFSSMVSMTTEEIISSEEAVKPRKISSATIPKLNEDKSTVGVGKRRPKRVTCYICGREFGTASFPIHEPKCLQKWHRENKMLSNSQRRNVPQRPNLPIDHEKWNNAAWEQSQALLIPCRKCKRTFLPDRLTIHERNCRVPNKPV